MRANAGEDAEYIRKRSVEKGEEIDLEKESHTVHFDGFKDQARDKENTKFLLPPEEELSPHLKSIEREEGLKEKHGLENIMEGREAYICFFSVSALKTQNFRFPPSK